jgi:hypothetical protein
MGPIGKMENSSTKFGSGWELAWNSQVRKGIVSAYAWDPACNWWGLMPRRNGTPTMGPPISQILDTILPHIVEPVKLVGSHDWVTRRGLTEGRAHTTHTEGKAKAQ